jgi:hypothetical protein
MSASSEREDASQPRDLTLLILTTPTCRSRFRRWEPRVPAAAQPPRRLDTLDETLRYPPHDYRLIDEAEVVRYKAG